MKSSVILCSEPSIPQYIVFVKLSFNLELVAKIVNRKLYNYDKHKRDRVDK